MRDESSSPLLVEKGRRPGASGFGAFLGLLSLLGFLGLVALRLPHPFELEWLEGISLFSIERLNHGLSLFVRPDFQWCPLPYGPLYFYGGSWASAAGLEGFVAPRAVSLVASLGLFAIVGACAVRSLGQEKGKVEVRWVAAGLVAAAYPFCGAWLDLARPDALALFFLMLACWSHLRSASVVTWQSAALTSLLALAAYHTKQTTLVPLLGFLVLDWPRSKWPLLGFVSGLVASLGLASFWTEGWYEFHTLEVLAGHGIHWPGLTKFVQRDLLLTAPILILAGWGWAGCPRALKGLLLGGVGASLLGRLHPGGYDNVLLPLVVCAAPLAARGWFHRPRLGNWGLAIVIVLGVRFAEGLVPSDHDVQAGERVIQRITDLEGGVFSPAHGYLLARAGKQHQLHLMSWMDLSASEGGLELAQELVAELEDRLNSGDLRHALVGQPRDGAEAEFVNLLRRYLPVEERLLPPFGPGSMTPTSGAVHKPELLLSAKQR